MSEWQPISTHPKFGTMFLIYVPTAKMRKVSISRGAGSGEKWFVEGGYTVFDDHGNPVRATKWRPMPEPPHD